MMAAAVPPPRPVGIPAPRETGAAATGSPIVGFSREVVPVLGDRRFRACWPRGAWSHGGTRLLCRPCLVECVGRETRNVSARALLPGRERRKADADVWRGSSHGAAGAGGGAGGAAERRHAGAVPQRHLPPGTARSRSAGPAEPAGAAWVLWPHGSGLGLCGEGRGGKTGRFLWQPFT